MEEIRVKGIILNSSDHKEKDKMVTIFTLEQGKINGVLKGVKLAKSKLKFASQPFCFAQFELVKNNDFYTITQVDLIEAFYDLTLDYDKFMRGASMLKVCNKVLKKGIVNPKLFLTLLNSLNLLTYSKADEKLIVIKFILEFLNSLGFGLNTSTCISCGEKLVDGAYFDNISGEFTCPKCGGKLFLDKTIFNALKQIQIIDFEEVENLEYDEKTLCFLFDMLNYELKRIIY